MLEKEFEISRLLSLQLQGALSAVEKKELEVLVASSEEYSTLCAEMSDEEHVAGELNYFIRPDKKTIWDKVQKELSLEEIKPTGQGINLWQRLAIAAMLALVLGLGWMYFDQKIRSRARVQYTTDVASGKFGATLTLANGKKIKLDHTGNGELARESGISITKNEHGQLVYIVHKNKEGNLDKKNTLSTAKGETYMVILPDQSRIWINASSTLTYSADLIQNGVRRVRLNGEAYFEITKDKVHPFIVESKGRKIEVLGTHFNVSAYEDDPAVRATLLEGSIKISPADQTSTNHVLAEDKILQPGQQAVYTSSQIKVIDVDASLFVDWKNGLFSFEDEDLRAIMKKISRWYDLDVIYLGTYRDSDKFSGSVSRSANVSEVLKVLSDISNLKFKIENRKILVSK